MFIIYKPTEFRENIIKHISDIIISQRIKNTESLESVNPTNTKLPNNIEKGIYNYSIREATKRQIIRKWENKYFVQLYLDRLKTIVDNLKTTPRLVDKLFNGEITPDTFAYMTHQEMHPEKWNEVIALKIKRDESKFVNRIEANTDMYQCRKCKSRKCTYISVQIRSADESENLYISCTECGFNFVK